MLIATDYARKMSLNMRMIDKNKYIIECFKNYYMHNKIIINLQSEIDNVNK
jgi:hypothetical protein